jgi:hypothetical protein
MNTYKSNAGLGYGQEVILVKLDQNQYVVIDNDNAPSYELGAIVTFEGYEVESTNYDTTNNNICKLIKHLRKCKGKCALKNEPIQGNDC